MGKDKSRIPNPSAPCCRISSPALVQALDFPTCLPCQGVFVRADGELLEAHPRMMAWGKNCLKNFVDLVLTTQHAGLFFYLEAQWGNPNVRTFFFPIQLTFHWLLFYLDYRFEKQVLAEQYQNIFLKQILTFFMAAFILVY